MSRDQQKEVLDIQKHNKKVLRSLKEGDMIEFKRGVYEHWAVYIGNGKVVHLTGDENDGIKGNLDSTHFYFTISGQRFNKAFVREENFFDVAGTDRAVRNNNKDKYIPARSPDEIVDNARSKLGEVGYNLFFHNCEHFASWCRYEVELSDQVDNLFIGVAAGASAGLLCCASQSTSDED